MPIKELPAELQNNPSLKDFNTLEDLAKSHIETKALVGGSIRIPSADAGESVKKDFLNKLHEKVPDVVYIPKDEKELAVVQDRLWGVLGKPADAKGYSLEGIDTAGVTLDSEALMQRAFEAGMTKAQFKAMAQKVVEGEREKAKALQMWQTQLKQEWGLAYDDKLRAAADVAAKLKAPQSIVEALKAGRMHPDHAKFYSGIAEALGGTGRQVGDQGGGKPAVTPQEAQQRIAEIQSDKDYNDPYTNPVRHDQLVARITELMPAAYPELAAQAGRK